MCTFAGKKNQKNQLEQSVRSKIMASQPDMSSTHIGIDWQSREAPSYVLASQLQRGQLIHSKVLNLPLPV